MATSFVIIAGKPTLEVDPDSDKDYSIVWDTWLGASDTIASAVWSITPSGPVIYGESINNAPVVVNDKTRAIGTVATCWIKTLTLGVSYTVTCRITSENGPRKDDQSFVLKVRSK